MTSMKEANDYFVKRAQCLNIPDDHIDQLWRYAKHIIGHTLMYLDTDYGKNAFIETTCNGIIAAYEVSKC